MNKINDVIKAMIEFDYADPKRIQHFLKVHSFAKIIGECEGLDKDTQYILEVSAITHDIGIKPAMEKYGNCDGPHQEELGPAYAHKMLSDLNFDADFIDRVCYIIGHHHTYTNVDGIDYRIILEADLLVNAFESNMKLTAIENSVNSFFETKTGKEICKNMFGLK